MPEKCTFAVYIAHRAVFTPGPLADARATIADLLTSWGHRVLMLPTDATAFGGAVESAAEGRVFASFLAAHRGEYQGIICVLPNFGNENGALAALTHADVPVFLQAYPDDMTKLSLADRRDAFCGKLSMMNVFNQAGIAFTIDKPHTVHPRDPRFRASIDNFDRVCKVVAGMKDIVVGAIGARTTPFKTVRVDEITLQRYGITVETLDMAEIIARVNNMPATSAVTDKIAFMQSYANIASGPAASVEKLAKLAVVLDQVIEQYALDALALRCWDELNTQLGIAGCVLLGMLNERLVPAACEVDVCSAIAMQALRLASDTPAACLDWNNNYYDEDDKCILFHCGPVPASLMAAPSPVTGHGMMAGQPLGCHVGRIASGAFTFGNMATIDGDMRFFLGEGAITPDPIADDFFGVCGVAHIPDLQDVLVHMGRYGHRHHVGITRGHVLKAVREALENYIGCEVAVPQEG
jgi:L-fucose isomerase-like protein